MGKSYSHYKSPGLSLYGGLGLAGGITLVCDGPATNKAKKTR